MKSKWYRTLLVYALIFLVVIGMAYMYTQTQAEPEVKEIEFSEFVTELQKGNVTELTLIDTSMEGTLKDGTSCRRWTRASL